MARDRAGRVCTWAIAAGLAGCRAEPLSEAEVVPGSSDETSADASSSGVGPTLDSGDDEGDSTTTEASSSTETTGEPVDEAAVRVAAGLVDDAERVETLVVARSEAQAQRRIALQLEPDQLPSLRAGDRLLTAAEVQVTTRCDVGQTAPGCDYDPEIAAQLVLTGDPEGTDPTSAGTVALSDVQTQTCTKGEHHCMVVFRPVDTAAVLSGELELPCLASGDCRVHLVMWAWDGNARAGGVDHVLVGENEGDYLANQVVGSDKARLMAVREHGEVEVQGTESSGAGSLPVPTDASATLVYSHLLSADGLRVDEQFFVEAKFMTHVSSRARVSSKMFVTANPEATEGEVLEVVDPQEIGEHNGINCTASTSPCTTRKVAVFRATADVEGPVYVNVIVRSAVPGGGTADVAVQREAGWVRATRWSAELDG